MSDEKLTDEERQDLVIDNDWLSGGSPKESGKKALRSIEGLEKRIAELEQKLEKVRSILAATDSNGEWDSHLIRSALEVLNG